MAETDTSFYIGKFIHELESGDPDAFLTRPRAFFAGIPYEPNDRKLIKTGVNFDPAQKNTGNWKREDKN